MISFDVPLPERIEDCDDEVLQNVGWSKAIPKSARRQLKQGETDLLALAIRKDLIARLGKSRRIRSSDPVWPRLDSRWSLSSLECDQRTADLLESLQSAIVNDLDELLTSWLTESLTGSPMSMGELLVATDLLANCAEAVSDELFWRLWRRTLACALEWTTQLNQADDKTESVDERLMARAELPIRIGLLFSSISGANQLVQRGVQECSRQLLEYTDADGAPFGAMVSLIPQWLAPMCRCLGWQRRLGGAGWGKESDERFLKLVTHTVMLLDRSGHLPCAASNETDFEVLIVAAGLAGVSGKEASRRLLKDVRQAVEKPSKRSPAAKAKAKSKKRPVSQSDLSRLAIARTNWTAGADLAVVAHHTPDVFLKLLCQGTPFLSGDWSASVRIDGLAVNGDLDWECTCWNSDSDGDYLELVMRLGAGVQRERQVFLARKDSFLMVSEGVRAKPGREIELESRLTLADGVKFKPREDSREFRLRKDGVKVRAIPVALPCDPVMSAAGSFQIVDGSIVLERRGLGGMYAPTVFTWESKGRKQPADWRSLTVTEEQRVVSPSEACAYRLKLGRRQLFLYRRLTDSIEAQCVLGHHSAHETLIGYFEREGLNPLLWVETEAPD